MPIMDITFRSKTLMRYTDIKFVLPEIPPENVRKEMAAYQRPTKMVILLNGYMGSNITWLYHTRLVAYSTKYNLAVAMPSGENSFYLDGKATGTAYCKYVGEELPDFLWSTFRMDMAYEDTFIGGNSMGGFGAIHTALTYPDTFSKVLCFSPAMHIHQIAAMTPEKQNGGVGANYEFYVQRFGDPGQVEESTNNPEVLLRRLKADRKRIPEIFITCGTEDFLLDPNREFKAFLDSEHIPVTYHEGPGRHDMDFWNQWIECAIKWAVDEN